MTVDGALGVWRPSRRGAKSSYPVGDETRARVVASAMEVFSQYGFKAASTREIAKRATVQPPALQYYFGSKTGLYQACVDAIMSSILARIGPLLDDAHRVAQTSWDTGELIASYCRLQDGAIDSFYAEGEGDNVGRMLSWESMTTEMNEAKEALREQVQLPFFRATSALLGRIAGRPANDLTIGLHTFAMSGIFMVFHLDAGRLFSALGWRAADKGNLKILKPILREEATWMLERLAATRGVERASGEPQTIQGLVG